MNSQAQALALFAALLLAAPFAQADNPYDESALYNETYTQSLNVGSEAIDCLKARKSDCGQKAWESKICGCASEEAPNQITAAQLPELLTESGRVKVAADVTTKTVTACFKRLFTK